MSEILQGGNDEWETPGWLFDDLNRDHKFTLDPCSNGTNNKCEKYFTVADDGLLQSWSGEVVFVNPPYSRVIKRWVEKCYMESHRAEKIVMLIPASTDTSYWHKWIFPFAKKIDFLRGRIPFEKNGEPVVGRPPFGLAVVVFSKRPHVAGKGGLV